MQQGDRAGVVVAGTGLDEPAVLHRTQQCPALVGAHDDERPVTEGADAAGRDVGVLGGEVGALLAALARVGVRLLQGDLVEVTVAGPDLEDALDVHLLDVGCA